MVRSKVRTFVDLDQQRKQLRRELEVKSRMVEEMRELKLAAEAASKAKTSFLANMGNASDRG